MNEKPNASHTLGLEYCGDSIKVAALSRDSKGPTIDWSGEIPVEKDSEANVKPLYTQDKKQQLEGLFKKNLVVTTLATNQVLVRPLSIKLKKISDIDAALYFQAEPLLPYPVENAIVDRVLLEKSKEGVKLTVVATRKDYLSSHLEFWGTLSVEPEVISCAPQALAAFSGKQENPLFAIHMSHNETTCALIKNGKLIAAKSFHKGSKDLFSAFQKDDPASEQKTFRNLDFTDLDETVYPSLAEAVLQCNLEITRIIFSHTKNLKGAEVNHVLVTGEAAALYQLDVMIANHLDKTLVHPEPRPLFSSSVKEQKIYALPIGMALTALNGEESQINFRQKEFRYPHQWKRVKKPVFVYLALCLLLTAALYLFTHVYVEYKQDSLKEEYASLLGFLKKPYTQFENEFLLNQKKEIDTVEIIPLKNLTREDLEERLQFIQKEIQEAPDTFPLLPNTPRVSDVLAWLSSHDVIIGSEGRQGAIVPRIQLEKFNYKMVKRPEKNKKGEAYQAKVDLEFTATSPRAAREFHDALLEPDPMIDPENEVKWSSSRGTYKTSFFLKDKTFYYKPKKS